MDGVYEYQMRSPYFASSPEISKTAIVGAVTTPQKLAPDYSLWIPLVAGTLIAYLATKK